jgi:hypothetical protein
MSEEAVRESQLKPDFEKVWSMFQETRQMMQESSRELDRRFKETDSKISRLGSRIGDMVEQLIAPNITEKFNKLGYTFNKVGPRVKYEDSQGHYLAEVDLLLENGDTVLVVEVKTNLTTVDVKDHVERMEKLRRYGEEHGDKRTLMGAVGGAIAGDYGFR